MGKNRRGLALCLIVAGMCTFFIPIVILDHPVLNRVEWSPLQIASSVATRQLPVPGGHFDEALIEIGLIYLLLIFSLVVLFVPAPPNSLKIFSAIGSVAGSLARFWHSGFLYTFGWEYFGQHMRRGPAWWILPWVMPALLAISLAKHLDRAQ